MICMQDRYEDCINTIDSITMGHVSMNINTAANCFSLYAVPMVPTITRLIIWFRTGILGEGTASMKLTEPCGVHTCSRDSDCILSWLSQYTPGI